MWVQDCIAVVVALEAALVSVWKCSAAELRSAPVLTPEQYELVREQQTVQECNAY